MRRIFIFLMILVLITACSPAEVPEQKDKLKVYTSFYAMYDFTRMLAGDLAEVENLVPIGVKPHDWEPSPRDMMKLEEADLFIYSGKGMEHWCEQVLETLSNEQLLAVETAQTIPDLSQEFGVDPHVWLDPENARAQMEQIADALIQKDPENATAYETRLEELRGKLSVLDATYREELSACPQSEIVVAHAAYGYLCNAYGLEQVAIEGIMADSDASPARIAEIIEFIKDNNIGYIFFETLVKSDALDTIIEETGVVPLELNPLEGDAKNRDYFTVMEENLINLTTALGRRSRVWNY